MRPPRLKLLRPSLSTGPAEGREAETGAPIVYRARCRACPDLIEADDEIVKHDGSWLHARCLSDWLMDRDAREAWLVIAGQVARTPSRYSTTETRAVLQALIRLAGGLPAVPFHEDDIN